MPVIRLIRRGVYGGAAIGLRACHPARQVLTDVVAYVIISTTIFPIRATLGLLMVVLPFTSSSPEGHFGTSRFVQGVLEFPLPGLREVYVRDALVRIGLSRLKLGP